MKLHGLVFGEFLAFVLAITGLYLIREILILLALNILFLRLPAVVDFLQKKKVSSLL